MPDSFEPTSPLPPDDENDALSGGDAPAPARLSSRVPIGAPDDFAPPAQTPDEPPAKDSPASPTTGNPASSIWNETERALWSSPTQGRYDHDEFERLFAMWKQNSDPRLRERLIFMHRNLVTFLARRFAERGELFEDVMQVGMLGLISAIDSFDPNRGVKFSTFAIPTISGEIRRYFRDKVAGMRVPRRLQELYSSLQGHIEELTQRLDRSPTYAEIAASLQLEVEEVVEALELGAALDPNSLDEFAYDDEEGTTVADRIGAPDAQIAAIEEYSTLQAALEELEPKKRQVLEMTYFEGYSQADVARRLNVSQMHVSRLLRRALADLRALLDEA